MTPITEHTLRTAAERAVARGHALSAMLFGSRARGNAGRSSDWDVCLVTDERPVDDFSRFHALAEDDPFWNDARVQVVWLPQQRFAGATPAGSIEAAIAREGRTLAGDHAVTTKARAVAFDAPTVLRNLGRVSERLFTAIEAARRHADETDETEREEITVTIVTTSIAGAEALGRALCALTETEHPGNHSIGRAGRRIAERASEPNSPLPAALTHEISQCAQALNDTAQAVRKVEYGEPGEPWPKTIERFARALKADLRLRQGLIAGSGPWAALAEHPHRAELVGELQRRTAARAEAIARAWGSAPGTLDNERLDQAVQAWTNGHHKLRESTR